MTANLLPIGSRPAHDAAVSVTIDLLHAVARGTACVTGANGAARADRTVGRSADTIATVAAG